MNKRIDVSVRVMDRVYTWERKRVDWWTRWFLVVLLVLLAAFVGLVWVAAQRVAERQTLELLTLFSQDWEVIAEFWLDTLMVVLQELPWKNIVLWGVVGIILTVYLSKTKETRSIVKRKMQQLDTYQHRKKERRQA